MEKKPEIFKPIKGYEAYYEVSSWGKVKSLAKEWAYGRKEESILKPSHVEGSYDSVTLCVDGVKKYVSVHLLVARHFCKKRRHCNIVNHLDSNIYNNYYENLEWTTYAGNAIHGYEHGNRVGMKGEKHGGCKLTKEKVIEMRDWYNRGETITEISKMYNVSLSHTFRILNNQKWTHI